MNRPRHPWPWLTDDQMSGLPWWIYKISISVHQTRIHSIKWPSAFALWYNCVFSTRTWINHRTTSFSLPPAVYERFQTFPLVNFRCFWLVENHPRISIRPLPTYSFNHFQVAKSVISPHVAIILFFSSFNPFLNKKNNSNWPSSDRIVTSKWPRNEFIWPRYHLVDKLRFETIPEFT